MVSRAELFPYVYCLFQAWLAFLFIYLNLTLSPLLWQWIERAARSPDDEKPDKKMTDSWEELGLVGTSPKLLRKGIEGVVMKQITAATKKGTEHTGCRENGSVL